MSATAGKETCIRDGCLAAGRPLVAGQGSRAACSPGAPRCFSDEPSREVAQCSGTLISNVDVFYLGAATGEIG